MATFSTESSGKSVYSKIQETHRQKKKSKPTGAFLIKNDTVVAPASYDVINDVIELIEFPDNSYLIGGSVVADKEYDTGGSAARLALVLDNGETSTYTTAVGSAFANQPANDSVSVHSTDAADTTQIVTVIGTTNGTDTVVTEDIALNGTNVVDSVKLDWGIILAFKLSAAGAGTVALEENSGNADIKTLAAGGLSSGVNSVTSTEQDFNDALVRLVASEASTKQIGLKGTDTDGSTIYDSQALSGTTQVLSNSRFVTVTEVYTGDLAATTTATISSSYPLLATGSQFATADPLPLNFNGSAVVGGEFGVDVSNKKLALVVEAAPTTANTSDITFTTKALIYQGEITNVGTSQA